MKILFRTLLFIGFIGIGFVACDKNNSNNNVSAVTANERSGEDNKGKKDNKPEIVFNEEGSKTVVDPNITTEPIETSFSYESVSMERNNALVNTQYRFSYDLGDGTYQTINHNTALTHTTGLSHHSQIFEAKNGDQLQIFTLCMVFPKEVAYGRCTIVGTRVYQLIGDDNVEDRIVKTDLTAYYNRRLEDRSNQFSNAPDLKTAIKSNNFFDKSRNNFLVTFSEFFEKADDFLKPRADLVKKGQAPSHLRDAENNRYLVTSEHLFFNIPKNYIHDSGNVTQDAQILRIRFSASSYFSPSGLSDYFTKKVLFSSEASLNHHVKEDDSQIGTVVQAAGLDYDGYHSGIFSEMKCLTEKCTQIHLMIFDEKTDPSQPMRLMGAYKFVQDEKDQTKWNLNVHSIAPTEELTMDNLGDYFQKLIDEKGDE